MAKRARAKVVPSTKRRRLATREDAVVTSFAIERDVHNRLRIAAIKLNWTMATVLRDAALAWLKQYEGGTK
ncbi:MAG: hypothetical protein ACRDI2_15270 [Chloroflexota bacterium]